jgi:F-type H+-transporting ATPase subunit gamma
MPSTRDIRRRIKSVKNTAKITKAMQTVASSKMQKAQQSAVNGRPFAKLTNQVMTNAAAGAEDFTHPLLEDRPVHKRGLVVVTTDRGLCGALNANLLREVTSYETDTTQFVAVGRKGAQFIARTKRKLVAEFTYGDTPTFTECQAIARQAKDLFLSGEVDQVEILYSRFINTLSQTPDTKLLLPLQHKEGLTAGIGKDSERAGKTEAPMAQYLFEPDANDVMETLLSVFLDFQIAQVLLEAKASEHSSRMVAMKNATENADELVKDLTLEFNKMRQAMITKELLEISSAAMALG